MKIEIEVDDKLIPFFQAEADSRGMSLEELLSAKVLWQRHDIVMKGGIPAAPREEEVATQSKKPGSD